MIDRTAPRTATYGGGVSQWTDIEGGTHRVSDRGTVQDKGRDGKFYFHEITSEGSKPIMSSVNCSKFQRAMSPAVAQDIINCGACGADIRHVFDGSLDSYKTSSRTAAEPGGVLPWTPSHRGYYWITKTDGTLEAVTNDGVNRMYLTEKPYGWEWVVKDDIGTVERGNFGTALKGGDALRDRANDLLAEFDTRNERRTRGPSRGYQDDYTQAPNTLWSRRKTTSQRYAERLKERGRR